MVVADGRWEPKLATLGAVYDQPTSIHHWQLKDLLACENPRTLYCVSEKSTVRYDTQTKKSSTVQSLDFAPNCMTVGEGYIAAGGPTSQLMITQLSDGSEVYRDDVGGTVNNSLLIKDGPMGLLLYVCNNDETVKVYSLPSMTPHTTLKFPVSMNYAAVDDQCEYMVSVGDSNVTYLHQATPSGYQKLHELRNYSDVGMCCAWDAQNTCFAAASQVGKTCVWDRRSCELVASFQTDHRQACRNVKFSSTPMDLLAFTEEKHYCHLIDVRKMCRRQMLRIDSDMEHDISGLAFSPNGSHVFVGTNYCGIYGFAVDTKARRRFAEGSLI
ncbi:hypothetical protein BSKO_00965 [Bryopsis sp. KO-2023]|nr:hypothetical protein BSKO_00965 [Bryopsis sp. KO-2023]